MNLLINLYNQISSLYKYIHSKKSYVKEFVYEHIIMFEFDFFNNQII